MAFSLARANAGGGARAVRCRAVPRAPASHASPQVPGSSNGSTHQYGDTTDVGKSCTGAKPVTAE